MADSVQDGTRMNSLIHRAVRRDLDDFAKTLDGFPAGDRERAAALADRFQWFDRLLTHHHEGEEEVLWPVLRTSPPTAEEVGELTDEHEHIVAALAAGPGRVRPVRGQRDGRRCRIRGVRSQGIRRRGDRAFHSRRGRARRALLAHADPVALKAAFKKTGSTCGSARGSVVHAMGVRRCVGGRQSLSPDGDPAARALDLEDRRRSQLCHIHGADSGVVLNTAIGSTHRMRS